MNRIDKDTSGLVLAAKNGYAAPLLAEGVEKLYYAIVEGELPLGPGIIDAPLAGEGTASWAVRDPRGQAQPHRVYHIKGSAGPEPCRLCPVTGRTHQSGALCTIGHPLAETTFTAGHRDRIARQALHCARQSFRVPAYTEVPGGIRLETPVGGTCPHRCSGEPPARGYAGIAGC